MTVRVHGTCAPGFDCVREEFVRNFTERDDVGAAVAATVDGAFVVDLWAGDADRAGTRPWQRDTLVNVYSTTKGLTALCAHLLVDRGELDLDAPVARYWPRFAQAGKAEIPVRWLLSHRSGLIAPSEPLGPGAVYDWEKVTEALAATAPWWPPGTAQGYHAVTFGFLVGEVVRRVTGVSLGTFLRAEVTGPLGADVFVGTPSSEHGRCADMMSARGGSGSSTLAPLAEPPVRGLDDHPMAPITLAFGYLPLGDVNGAAYRSAEIPAANGHATARGLATVYRELACGRLLAADTVERLRTPQGGPGEPDLVLRAATPLADAWSWGLGFMPNQFGQAGTNPRAFGHGGAGGSYAFADPENRVSYAYTMNRMGAGTSGEDLRSVHLVGALYKALGAMGS
ncbi:MULTISPECIES: serine hydrolase domain-containing protein [Streptomyces]|uniref:serine hydrolase domain-containing protein n=1 Tax=Streptomyces TaxID=1883 RepID=UPI001E2D889E|nr:MULTISPECIES: serine hydrolase domain-containing protein [Streptomyces]UFQ19274.1 beta-lactamase family protein [Streptomyces huasconensis]WCL88893.1 serine hydrolase [Streptomyces sp. JCM 35825]